MICDSNTPTNVSSNQDEIYILSSAEAHLWEEPNGPVMVRAEQPNVASLGVLFVAYQYFAFTFQRYGSGAVSKVNGAGLVTPAF